MLSISKYQCIFLGCISVIAVGLAGYLAGRAAQIKFADMMSDKTPPPDARLEQEGRYDEAIQVVLSPNKERPIQPEDYSRVAFLYLEWAKKDSVNRVDLAHKSAAYSEKAVQMAPNDPFMLETALNNLDRAGDYLENGCPYYEEAQAIGEKALALTGKETVNVRGMSYPTQQFKESVPYFLKRIRTKVKAWCNKP